MHMVPAKKKSITVFEKRNQAGTKNKEHHFQPFHTDKRVRQRKDNRILAQTLCTRPFLLILFAVLFNILSVNVNQTHAQFNPRATCRKTINNSQLCGCFVGGLIRPLRLKIIAFVQTVILAKVVLYVGHKWKLISFIADAGWYIKPSHESEQTPVL